MPFTCVCDAHLLYVCPGVTRFLLLEVKKPDFELMEQQLESSQANTVMLQNAAFIQQQQQQQLNLSPSNNLDSNLNQQQQSLFGESQQQQQQQWSSRVFGKFFSLLLFSLSFFLSFSHFTCIIFHLLFSAQQQQQQSIAFNDSMACAVGALSTISFQAAAAFSKLALFLFVLLLFFSLLRQKDN